MGFSRRIAKRYFFSKSTPNAINIISGISVLGIAIGTAALILVLSVFNGFGDLITDMFGYFNPDVKIELARGKFFEEDPAATEAISKLDNVRYISRTIEEIAFFEYNNNQDFGVIKGVDQYYP
ncbi:MAG: ABC transporter permease, partial [Bacteroidia bacterium]|nr:ABC transporter permease [Bacteroidia bacterium]